MSLERPNILLIVLDATRADACSCYGADRPTTPNLDRLAGEGVLYEQAISAAPWTLPAFASLFTGFFPDQIAVYEQRRVPPSIPVLAGILSQQGYPSYAVTGNSWLSDDFGLTRGFDRVVKLWQILPTSIDINAEVVLGNTKRSRSKAQSTLSQWLQGNPLKNIVNTAYHRFWAFRRDYGASRMLAPLLRWTRAQQSPWFALVHYMEAHQEYKPPRSWARRFARDWETARGLLRQDQTRLAWRHSTNLERLSEKQLAALRDLYLAEVAYADSSLGELVHALEQEGQLDRTVVVVTADHGESLGEHGLMSHQFCVYDTLIRVPLVIRYPPIFGGGKRISGQVHTLDLYATLLSIAGAEVPPSASCLLPPLSSRSRNFTVAQYGPPRMPHPAILQRFGLRPEHLRPVLRGFTALRDERYKLIMGTDGSVELYDWRQDPKEERDLACEQPQVVFDLQKKLEQWREELQVQPHDRDAPGQVDSMTASRLRGLGYIE